MSKKVHQAHVHQLDQLHQSVQYHPADLSVQYHPADLQDQVLCYQHQQDLAHQLHLLDLYHLVDQVLCYQHQQDQQDQYLLLILVHLQDQSRLEHLLHLQDQHFLAHLANLVGLVNLLVLAHLANLSVLAHQLVQLSQLHPVHLSVLAHQLGLVNLLGQLHPVHLLDLEYFQRYPIRNLLRPKHKDFQQQYNYRQDFQLDVLFVVQVMSHKNLELLPMCQQHQLLLSVQVLCYQHQLGLVNLLGLEDQ